MISCTQHIWGSLDVCLLILLYPEEQRGELKVTRVFSVH